MLDCSIGQALSDAARRLEHSGVLNPAREATALWAAVEGWGVKPGDVWLRRDATPLTPVAERFWDAVGHRSRGVPFSYAVGRASFRTLELLLDRRALIPRPETEGLVGLVLDSVAKGGTGNGKGGIAADIGTGCGCIALSLALEGDFERVVAVERSVEAAALARENLALVAPAVPVEIVEGDLLAPLAARGERYRVIVSNPPYLTDEEFEALPPAVKEFEPREALVSGPDGLAVTRALLSQAAGLLEPHGLLALEIDERRADAVRGLAREYGWHRLGIHNDLFGRPRYALAIPRED